jgi:hypothetical protein
MLALSRILDQRPGKLRIVAMQGDSFAFGDKLSPAVEEKLESLIALVTDDKVKP